MPLTKINLFTNCVQKEIDLFQTKSYCFIYNSRKLVSLKTIPFAVDTLFPASFPVLEDILRDE